MIAFAQSSPDFLTQVEPWPWWVQLALVLAALAWAAYEIRSSR